MRFVDPTGLNYEDLTEHQRKLVDEWAGRQNKANNTSASAKTTYNSLTESQRATAEAVLNALENTTIIAAYGTQTNALSMTGQIDSIAGRQDGKGGAEQLRLYVTLAEGASATLKDAQNMYSVRAPGHFDAQNKRFGGTPLRRRYDPNSK